MIKRIIKLLKLPKSFLLSWVAFLFSPLLSYLRLRFIESTTGVEFRVVGLSTLLYYVPYVISFVAAFILYLHFKELIKVNGSFKNIKKIFTWITVLTSVFLVFAGFLFNLEATRYPNYIYSHYGVTLTQLQFIAFISFLEVTVFLAIHVYMLSYDPATKKMRSIKFLKRSSLEKISLLISIVALLSMVTLSATTYFQFPYLYNDSRRGYENKVGADYKYIRLLELNTGENVKIIHPPQGDRWPAIGNQPVLRFFLYPKVLISGVLINNQKVAQQIGEAYFVIIDSTDSRPKWPEINNVDSLIKFDETTEVKYKDIEEYFFSDGVIVKIIF